MDPEKCHLLEECSSAASLPLTGVSRSRREDRCSTSTECSEDGPQGRSGHCHQDGDDPLPRAELEGRRSAGRRLLVAGVLSLVFMAGEVVGGYAAQSLAIMTDAAHLLTDFGSIMISLFSLWISSRPPTKTMTFGWHRAETLGALLSVLSIWAVTGVLVFLAVQRIVDDDYEIQGQTMVITSGCAVGVNVLMLLILHQSGSAHGHGHSHGSAGGSGRGRAGRRGNTSVRAAFVHVVGDLLQSVGVLTAAVVIHFRPDLKMADPICTFLFSALVLGTTGSIIKDVCRTLMEGTPRGLDADAVRETLLSVHGVKAVHDLRTWSLSTSRCLVSVHLAVEEIAQAQTVVMETTDLLRCDFGFSGITVQVERHTEDMLDCARCRDPTP